MNIITFFNVPSQVLGTLGAEMKRIWTLSLLPASKEVDLGHSETLSSCFLGDTNGGPFSFGPAFPSPIKVLIGLLGNAEEGGRNSFRPPGPPCPLSLTLTHHPHLVLASGSPAAGNRPEAERAGAGEGREVAPARVAALPILPAFQEAENCRPIEPTRNS